MDELVKTADSGTGFVRRRQFARHLGITEKTVDRWIAKGKLPSIKFEGLVLIPRSAVLEIEAALSSGDAARSHEAAAAS